MSENKRGENNLFWKNKVVKMCEQCGREYDAYPFEKDTRRFCSRECVGKWRSENIRGDSHPFSKDKIVKTCEQCGGEFEAIPSRKDARFCSNECHNIWMSENQRGENSPTWKGGTIKKICEQCGEEFEVYPSQDAKRRFCSTECMGKGLSGENNHGWQGGISFEPYCPKFNEAFRESIREKFGRICFLCPTTEEENGTKLSVHHVNYDKNCLCNDSDCEFVPLCMPCHLKTNFNREYWEEMIMEKLEVML
jgi:uncharacterized protein (DUF983 family)